MRKSFLVLEKRSLPGLELGVGLMILEGKSLESRSMEGKFMDDRSLESKSWKAIFGKQILVANEEELQSCKRSMVNLPSLMLLAGASALLPQ